tara:strand:+ start:333 stop:905 length:573 start_codon:yes stop_codon:yes gene_type:complete
MIEKEIVIGNDLKIIGHKYENKDKTNLLELFNNWLAFKASGKLFKQRANLPESLTEGLITLHIEGVYRKIESKAKKGAKTKFDCYNENTKKIIEVKGASIPNDLSSWSPSPFFDLFYFVDFSSLNGKYKIYEFNISSSSSEFLNVKNKKGVTNETLMKAGRRPRFSITEEFINNKIGCNGLPIVSGDLNS